jgi:dipeptidyl aminopeptidase/acylaminoacyl peptidase
VTPPQPVPTGVAWAPDGRSLAYASSGHIWTIDLATHRSRRITSAAADSARWPAWSPDGTRIAYTTGNRYGVEVAAVVPRGGGVVPMVVAYTSSQVAWTPDGASILADERLWSADGSLQPADGTGLVGWSGDRTRVLRRDPATQALLITTAAGAVVATVPSQLRLTHPTLSWHGDALAGATVAGHAYVIDLADGARHPAPQADSQHDSVRWSRAGVVAYVGRGRCGPRSEIDTMRADGSGVETLARACA